MHLFQLTTVLSFSWRVFLYQPKLIDAASSLPSSGDYGYNARTKCLRKITLLHHSCWPVYFIFSNSEATRWLKLSVWQQLRCRLCIPIFDLSVQKDYYDIKGTFFQSNSSPQIAIPNSDPPPVLLHWIHTWYVPCSPARRPPTVSFIWSWSDLCDSLMIKA